MITATRASDLCRNPKAAAAPRTAAQRCALPDSAARFRQGVMGGRLVWSGLVTLALIWGALLLTTQNAAAQGYKIYVPMVTTEGSEPGGTGEEPEECGLNAEETAFAQILVSAAEQGRSNPVCDPILAQVARARARDMALRGYFSHTNPDGNGPNLLVRQAGYPLPDWYSDDRDSNNIESIGGGYDSPDAMWTGWMNSTAHRNHVLATQRFYADQEAYGIGYYFDPNSPLKHYWVFLSAPVAGK